MELHRRIAQQLADMELNAGDWDESKHPRGRGGKWASGTGDGGGTGGGTGRKVDDVVLERSKTGQPSIRNPGWQRLLQMAGGNEGHAYVLHDTLTNLRNGQDAQTAFHNATENQNYHGNRPDIRKDREDQAALMQKHFGVHVDAHGGYPPDKPDDGEQHYVMAHSNSPMSPGGGGSRIVKGLDGNPKLFGSEEAARAYVSKLNNQARSPFVHYTYGGKR
jgi:hypothetical protein